MKKQGFTLIELMVVIVIMGILAAVAVPKLFGMIAKSKASEVGPAAGTYVKLQQAYISEAVAVGNWQIIGYKGPGDNTKGTATGGDKSGTTNFKYADAVEYTNNTVALDNTERAGFVAANQAKLNDCAAKAGDASATNYNWKVTVKKSTSSEGDAVFTSTTNCTELTPNFAKIGG